MDNSISSQKKEENIADVNWRQLSSETIKREGSIPIRHRNPLDGSVQVYLEFFYTFGLGNLFRSQLKLF